MDTLGFIVARIEYDPLDLDAWKAFVAGQPQFRPMAAREGKNPFTGATIRVAFPHSVEVFESDHLVGSLAWDETRITVRGHAEAMAPTVQLAVQALSAVFQEPLNEEPDHPPGLLVTTEERFAHIAKSRARDRDD